MSNFHFSLMNFLVYFNIDQGIHSKNYYSWVFFLYEYRKFWSISSEFKLELKWFILEVWICIKHTKFLAKICIFFWSTKIVWMEYYWKRLKRFNHFPLSFFFADLIILLIGIWYTITPTFECESIHSRVDLRVLYMPK